MSLKTTFATLVFVLFAEFALGELKRCSKQKDCNVLTECCSKRFLSDESYCVQYRQLGELCLDMGMDQMMINGTYDITCPCGFGLECIKPTYYDGYGRLLYTRNPRCQQLGYEQPPLEYYLNNNRNYGPNSVYASTVNNGYPYSGNNGYPSRGYGYGSNAGGGAYAFARK